MKLTPAESDEIDRLLSAIEVAGPHTSAELADQLLEYIEAIERRNLAGESPDASCEEAGLELSAVESEEIDRLLNEIEVADPHTSAELADRLLEYVEAIEQRNLAGTSAGAEIALPGK